MHKHLHRAGIGLVTTALITSGTLLSGSASAAPNIQADAASDWLAAEFGKQNPWQQAGWPSYGPTLDGFFAFSDLGVRAGVRQQILDAIEADVDGYAGRAPYAVAGATGKLLTALHAQGIDPASYEDGDLVQRLEALVDTTGADTGRAKDTGDPTDTWPDDYSNTIGQSFVVRALTGEGSALADETLGFLLKQQCGEGYFRFGMESTDGTCDAGTAEQSRPDVDSTAFAVQALLTANEAGIGDPVLLETALARAGRWLASRQRAGGGFSDDGVVSANTTGVAAQAFVALGLRGRAGNSAEWLRLHQVNARLARDTAFGVGDIGAIAPNTDELEAGTRAGITRGKRINWRLATAQSAVGVAALLRPKELLVTAPARAAKGAKVEVRTSSLAAGERFTVKRGSVKVAGGWVPSNGRVVVRVAMPARKSTVTVKVFGSRASRVGSDVVKVG